MIPSSEPVQPLTWAVVVPLYASAFSRCFFRRRTTWEGAGYFVTVNVAVAFCGPLPAGPMKTPETL